MQSKCPAVFHSPWSAVFHSFFCLAASSWPAAHFACSWETKDSILSARSVCAARAVEYGPAFAKYKYFSCFSVSQVDR